MHNFTVSTKQVAMHTRMVPRNSTLFTRPFFTGRCMQARHETKCTTPKVHMYTPYTQCKSCSDNELINLVYYSPCMPCKSPLTIWNEPQSHLETSADIAGSTHLLIHLLIHPFFPFLSSHLAFPHCQHNFGLPSSVIYLT